MLEGAQKDYLTGCFNKEAINPFLEKAVAEAKSHKKGLSIVVIDLDHFKKFNDKFGHIFGDDILKYISSTIRLTLGNKAQIFRYGGDEFISVFINTGPKDVSQLVRLCNTNTANRPFLYQGSLYKVTISCGIATFPHGGDTKEKLIGRADKAMYFSKRYGGNLTTEANRMLYIRFRNIAAGIVGIFAILFLVFALNRYIYKEFLQNIVSQVKSIKVTAEPKYLDTIISKKGNVFKGHIVEETDDVVVISFEMKEGDATLALGRDEISKIKYGSKTK